MPPGENTNARGAPVEQEGGRQGGRCRAQWEEVSWAWCEGKEHYQSGYPCVRKEGRRRRDMAAGEESIMLGEKDALKECSEVTLGSGLGVVSVYFYPHSTSPLFNEFICKGWSEGRLTSQ